MLKDWLWRHEAIGIVTNLAPGHLGQGMAGEEGSFHGGEFDSDTDGGTAFGEGARNEKFVLAELAV